jgi:hypothetical protein
MRDSYAFCLAWCGTIRYDHLLEWFALLFRRGIGYSWMLLGGCWSWDCTQLLYNVLCFDNEHGYQVMEYKDHEQIIEIEATC